MGSGIVQLYLASRSPRRRELLAGLGYRFAVLEGDVNEQQDAGESPFQYVERMAREKAVAGFDLITDREARKEGAGVQRVVVGADTVILIGDRVLRKPRNDAEVLSHIRSLSNRRHEVLSAVAVVYGRTKSPTIDVRLCRSSVWFRRIPADEREAYRATGEPFDKAGAYAIQGLGAAFVSRLEGSWSGVVGLPLFETAELLCRAGVPYLKL